MIRWSFMLAYCTLLLLGCIAIILRQTPPFPLTYLATRQLPVGHLLQPGDLQPVAAGGRYLTQAVKPGGMVRLDTAEILPALRHHADRLLVAFGVPVDTVKAGTAEAGANIFICGAEVDAASGPYLVQDTLCTEGAANCILLLDAPVDQAKPLAAVLAAEHPSASGKKCPTR